MRHKKTTIPDFLYNLDHKETPIVGEKIILKTLLEKEPLNKPILVEYSGGNYPGCFWEPNFCLIIPDVWEKTGFRFKNIFSSGKDGITESKTFINRVQKICNPDEYEVSDYFHLYPLHKADTIEWWNKLYIEIHPTFLLRIYKGLYTELKIKAPCGICENFKLPTQFINPIDLGFYSGNGGIGIVGTEKPVCKDCVKTYKCKKCKDFMGLDKDFKPTQEICGWCTYEQEGLNEVN